MFNRIFLSLLLAFSLLFCSCTAAVAASGWEQTDGEKTFTDTLTFLGDSTTAHMLSRAPIANAAQIWCTKDRYLNLDPRITRAKILLPNTTEEVTVGEAAARLKPRRLVITLGIDYGVYYYRNDENAFRLCYCKLLDAVREASPTTNIILHAIFPVGRESTVITNEMVARANRVIAAIAKERGLVFVDATAALSDAAGYLAPQYCFSEDGIHLTKAAYDVIFENLTKYQKEIEEKEC